MEPSILIHFDSVTGEVRVEALCFEGLTCLAATQPFEEALGVVEGEHTYKPEAQTRRMISTHQTQLRQ